MKSTVVHSNVTAPTAAPAAGVDGIVIRNEGYAASHGKDDLVVQVSPASGTPTFTVRIFGRLSPALPWQQMGADVTAAGIVALARVPFLFVQVQAVAAGGVSVGVGF